MALRNLAFIVLLATPGSACDDSGQSHQLIAGCIYSIDYRLASDKESIMPLISRSLRYGDYDIYAVDLDFRRIHMRHERSCNEGILSYAESGLLGGLILTQEDRIETIPISRFEYSECNFNDIVNTADGVYLQVLRIPALQYEGGMTIVRSTSGCSFEDFDMEILNYAIDANREQDEIQSRIER